MDSIWIPCGMWGESKDLLIYLHPMDAFFTIMCPLWLSFIIKLLVVFLNGPCKMVFLIRPMGNSEDISLLLVMFQDGEMADPFPDVLGAKIKAEVPTLWLVLWVSKRLVVNSCTVQGRCPVGY